MPHGGSERKKLLAMTTTFRILRNGSLSRPHKHNKFKTIFEKIPLAEEESEKSSNFIASDIGPRRPEKRLPK
jgi:hypothetical protein